VKFPLLFNHVLDSLMIADQQLLAPHLEHIELPLRFQMELPNRPVGYIYFPTEGLISVVAKCAENHQIEVGIIGHDGMSGHSLIMSAMQSPHSVYMQIAGRGLRISASSLQSAIRQSATLQQSLLPHVQAFMIQSSFTALANGRAKMDARLARWLLMASDRLSTARLPLTHEFLGLMLGVRRAGVSVALQQFVELGLITSERGGITICDRKALEEKADGFYGIPEREQERLTGWRPVHAGSLPNIGSVLG
jgi:CRP-like cAMP-binding protein